MVMWIPVIAVAGISALCAAVKYGVFY